MFNKSKAKIEEWAEARCNPALKQIILDKEFKTPEFYFYYPHLFKGAFQAIEEDKIDSLSIAGFLIYKSLILQDKVVDNDIPKSEQNKFLIESQQLYEEGIKLLKDVYKENEEFWKLWNIRKVEYGKALIKNNVLDNHIEDKYEFEQFCDYKSAFGKVAIDSLFILEGKQSNEIYENLLDSHKFFSTAFQIYDDIKDFKKDLLIGQRNIAISTLFSRFPISSNGKLLKEEDILRYERLLYTTQIVEELLDLSLLYLDKAKLVISKFDKLPWQYIINDYINHIARFKRIQACYLKQIEAECLNSTKKIYTFSILYLSNNVVKKTINRSINFILNRQNKDGSWDEYLTSGSVSNLWSTAFIHANLLGITEKYDAEKTTKYLIQKGNPLWSYNENWPCDADSSNFVLLSLIRSQKFNINDYLSKLVKYQNEDGGFSTYTNNQVEYLRQGMHLNEKVSFCGWIQSHQCVSSVSSLVLCHSHEYKSNYGKLISYFEQQLELNNIGAYWWTSNLYTLSFLLQLIAEDNGRLLSLKLISQIIDNTDISFNKSLKNGLIHDMYGINFFYSGLVLGSMLRTDKFYNNKVRNRLYKVAKRIISEQMDDGSWIAGNALRLPKTNIINPDTHPIPIKAIGLNVRGLEYNRLFTTSVCLNALYQIQ